MFDVLVGINLLREGLDMPEVALVAILDADKEGFLRSDGSLIQTMGRAARNLNGRAILYADRVTGSMQRATRMRPSGAATSRSSTTLLHGITPRSIIKPVADIMEGARAGGAAADRQARAARTRQGGGARPARREPGAAAIVRADQGAGGPRCSRKARNLEFEEAAALRDQIEKLQALELGLGGGDRPRRPGARRDDNSFRVRAVSLPRRVALRYLAGPPRSLPCGESAGA